MAEKAEGVNHIASTNRKQRKGMLVPSSHSPFCFISSPGPCAWNGAAHIETFSPQLAHLENSLQTPAKLTSVLTVTFSYMEHLPYTCGASAHILLDLLGYLSYIELY